jgi:predicted aldo/keto reductase-like oxidoreductase
MSERDERGIDRRNFLLRGAAGVAGLLGASGLDAIGADSEARVRRYAPLGKTGLEISDISFGSSRTSDPAVVRLAFERGVNYFDSAEGYKGGDSETAIGEALHDVRDRVFLTSKTKAGADATGAEMMKALEGSLARLRTDYVDVYFNHAVNDVDRMRNEEWAEFTERAKQQGKIRFRGMSGHAGKLVECLKFSLDNGLLDVMLVAYNFGQDPAFYARMLNTFDFVTLQPDLPPLLARAHAEGVGVVAMKTLMGGRANDMRPYETPGSTFAQAAFRWTLSNSDVDALVISMKSAADVDEYLGASGARATSAADLRLLAGYAARNGARYCQPGCDVCADSCPLGVDISEVLRTRMYDIDYGDRDFARRDYAQLANDASPCLDCTATPCAGACPNGIPIPQSTRQTALRLT